MRFQFVIIYRFMTHPLLLLFLVVGNILIGRIDNVFWSILGWLFINFIFGKSSYLYDLFERKRLEREIAKQKETEIYAGKKLSSPLFPPEKEDNTKKSLEEHYKLWGGVEDKDKKSNSNKQIYEEYLDDKEKRRLKKFDRSID